MPAATAKRNARMQMTTEVKLFIIFIRINICYVMYKREFPYSTLCIHLYGCICIILIIEYIMIAFY